MSYIIGGMQEGIKAVTRFADVALAKDADSRKIAVKQLGEMTWKPWTEVTQKQV